VPSKHGGLKYIRQSCISPSRRRNQQKEKRRRRPEGEEDHQLQLFCSSLTRDPGETEEQQRRNRTSNKPLDQEEGVQEE